MEYLITIIVIMAILVLIETFLVGRRFILKRRHLYIRRKMAELMDKIHEDNEPSSFYKVFVEMILKFFTHADDVILKIQDDDSLDKLKIVAQTGESSEYCGISVLKSELLLAQFDKISHSAILIHHPTLAKFLKSSKDSDNFLKEAIVIPIFSFGTVYGLLYICGYKERTFKKKDVELAKYISDEINFIMEYYKMIDEKSKIIDYDQLTSLNSRLKFLKQLNACAKNNSPQESYVFVIIDLDNFKEVNDTYGHIVGDKTLQFFSVKIKSILTKQDICGRYGGDEFGLILQTDNLESVHEKLHRLRHELKESVAPKDVHLSFTYGLFPFYSDGQYSASQIIEMADKVLYLHKDLRKSKII